MAQAQTEISTTRVDVLSPDIISTDSLALLATQFRHSEQA
jgi:hypothetical protein